MRNHFSFRTIMSAVVFMYGICLVSNTFESAVLENCRLKITEVTILFFSITQMIHDFWSLYMWVMFVSMNKNCYSFHSFRTIKYECFFSPLCWACFSEHNCSDIKRSTSTWEMCSYNSGKEPLPHKVNTLTQRKERESQFLLNLCSHFNWLRIFD